jgi:hypothetical protein
MMAMETALSRLTSELPTGSTSHHKYGFLYVTCQRGVGSGTFCIGPCGSRRCRRAWTFQHLQLALPQRLLRPPRLHAGRPPTRHLAQLQTQILG